MTLHRREFLKTAGAGALALAFGQGLRSEGTAPGKRPNILFCIADDWNWPHAFDVQDDQVKTPTYDRMVREGVRFSHAFVTSPSCTPSRASILTGQWFARLEESANLHSTLKTKFTVYPGLFEAAGYHVGLTGKGWGPGRETVGGWDHNPAGKSYASFDAFLKARPAGTPFCYWFGSHDPHRPYERDSGVKSGMKPAKVKLPPCLPDDPVVRRDLCDYYFEVERFDRDVGALVKKLEELGELDRTIVVMTGDNGLPFPRCKSTIYDTGTHVPLVFRWPEGFPGRAGATSGAFVSLSDLAPTFLEAAGLKPAPDMTGRSLLPLLKGDAAEEKARDEMTVGKERHTQAQADGPGGTPMRGLRNRQFLYIRNFKPERWQAGTPPVYRDIDGSPSKSFLVDHADDPAVKPFLDRAGGKRPAEELYDLAKDPYQLTNVAGLPEYETIRKQMADRLITKLGALKDPRATGGGDEFDHYPYYGDPNYGEPRTSQKKNAP